MSVYRKCLAGSLILLSACSMATTHSIQPPAAAMPAAAVPASTRSVATKPSPAVPRVVASRPVPAVAVAVPEPIAPVQPVSQPAHKPPTRSLKNVDKTDVRHVRESVRTTASRRSGEQISGQVTLAAASGQSLVAGDLSRTLVYFVPDRGGAKATPGHYTVYTHNRDFSPEAIAVPLGSTVTFVNLDDVRHNVFSVTPGSAFDLGYQGAGEKASHVFSHAGVVLVSCHVHRSMEMDMLMVPTAYAAKVDGKGRFELDGLPPGPGTLHFWNPRAQPALQKVTLPATVAVKQRLLVTRDPMTSQLNAKASP